MFSSGISRVLSRLSGFNVAPGFSRTWTPFGILILAMMGVPVVAQQTGSADAPIPAALRDYRAVTAERLRNPEERNWLMIRRTYDGWGYSPLNQITERTCRSSGWCGRRRPASRRCTKRRRS